jgi:hypothetical protein
MQRALAICNDQAPLAMDYCACLLFRPIRKSAECLCELLHIGPVRILKILAILEYLLVYTRLQLSHTAVDLRTRVRPL